MLARTSRLLLAGLFSTAVALSIVGPAPAQDRDILKDAEARRAVELQRVKDEFKQTNDEATNLGRDNPTKALQLLKSMRDKIQSNADIPQSDRDAMVRKLDLRISAFTDRINSPTTIPNPIPAARQEEEKQKAREAERQKRLLEEVERLRRAGQIDEANRLASQIALDNPNSAGAQGARKQMSLAQAKAQDDYLREQKRQGFLAVQMDIDKATIPQSADITFPKDWRERTAKRSQINLTAEEKKIIKALNSPVNIDLKDSSLEAVIDYLQDKTGVKILVPQTILDEKGITYKTPVSVSFKNVTLRTILKKTLADVGLTYIVKDNVVQVTTEERAKKTLTTRTYYIGDLVGMTAFNVPYAIGSQARMWQAVNDIIGVVVSTEPDSWWLNGGPGTVAFDPRTMTLIVRQTAEMHYQLGLAAGGR